MLQHMHDTAKKPARVVILGKHGFVAQATHKRLQESGIEALAVGREALDLCAEGAATRLTDLLQTDDVLVMTSAIAPCKTIDDFIVNLQMVEPVAEALSRLSLQQLIYISSDAVYPDLPNALTEVVPPSPTSLHGMMHATRELILSDAAQLQATPALMLRPTLIYGKEDTHAGYGPNLFYRLAANNKPIQLYGKGEELRDHIHINDVTRLIELAILHGSYGILNAVTGQVSSFHDIATLIAEIQQVPIEYVPRKGSMPHNGYRAFDNALCRQAFPEFTFKPLTEGVIDYATD